MYSNRFSPLIRDNPTAAESLHHLEQHFKSLEESQQDLRRLQFDANRLAELAHTPTFGELQELLSVLLQSGLMRRVVVIESNDGGVVKELQPGEKLPERVLDINRDVMMDVTIDNIQSVYRLEAL